jgi:OCT family organic cation transporter-like MFS transporter 4/5
MDQIYEEVGAFGKFQKIILIQAGSLVALCAITIYLTVFTLAEPKLICDYIESNQTDNFSSADPCILHTSQLYSNNSTCRYDQAYYKSTIVTEWDLFCGRKYLASMVQMSYMLGAFFSLFSGSIGDYYGRKCVASITLVLLSLISLLSQLIITVLPRDSINSKYLIYSSSQFFIGFLANLLYCASFVHLMEMTSKRYHSLFSIIYTYFYVFGELFVVIIAYFVRDWFVLQWILAGLTTATTVLVIIFVPESPSWLISKKRFAEADKLLQMISKINKKSFTSMSMNAIDEVALLPNNEQDPKSSGILSELFCPIRNTVKTLFLCYMMTVAALTYYGIGLGLTKMNLTNPYFIYLLSSIAEFIGYSLCYVNQYIGRKKTNIIFFIGTAVSCILVGLATSSAFDKINNGKFRLVAAVVFVTLSKCMISTAQHNLIVYAAELYPTSCRSAGILLISGVSRTGSFLSPFVILMGSLYWPHMPFFLYSLVHVIAVIMCFFLPESRTGNLFVS